MLVLVLVITVIGSFQVFDTVAVTTKGGPVNATRVMQLYIIRTGLRAKSFRLRQRDVGRPVPHPLVVALIQLRVLHAGESDLA